MEKNNNRLLYFVLICNPKHKTKMLTLLQDNGARSISTISAKGSAPQSAILQAFGLEASNKKYILTTLLPYEVATNLIEILKNEYDFNKPNTGIAFTIPVEGLLF